MIIQINTDATLTSHEDRREEIKAVVTNALEYFSERISRVEVHLSREDGHPHVQNQLRCMMEARRRATTPGRHAPLRLDGRSSRWSCREAAARARALPGTGRTPRSREREAP